MGNGREYSTMKMALAACIGVIVTGATAWVAFGQDKVTRPEMAEYVGQQAPWVRDKGEIIAGIKSNVDTTRRLEVSIQNLVDVQTQLLVEQRVLVQRVEDLLEDR